MVNVNGKLAYIIRIIAVKETVVRIVVRTLSSS